MNTKENLNESTNENESLSASWKKWIVISFILSLIGTVSGLYASFK